MVIPVFNDRDSLEVLLKKIDTMETPGFHFLIVDNGSTDLELSTYLENGGTNWSSIRTPQNLGFGGGHNVWNQGKFNGMGGMDAGKS